MTLHPEEAVVEQTFPASLQGKDNVQLRSQISGYIDKIYVDEGTFVKAGQPLFRINTNVEGIILKKIIQIFLKIASCKN